MDPSNSPLSRLENMPDDMLRVILSKVGATSATDFCNAVLSCKRMKFGLDDPLISKTLSIAHFVKNPDLASGHEEVMKSLLAANNVDAHYVKGLREYFYFDNQDLGLHHLRIASKGGNKNARYLYGVLHMALGMIEKGKKMLSKFTDAVGIQAIETIWEEVQGSLGHLSVSMKDEYVDTLIAMEPELNCHPPEINTVCFKCYHAHLMTEFFELALGINPAPEAA